MAENKEELMKVALKQFGATELNAAILKEISLETLLLWSHDETDPKLCFRSAWALEHIFMKENSYFKSAYKTLIKQYADLNNWSSLRSYTKLIMWLLSKSNTSISLSEEEKEIILEKSFAICENITCPVAVKVNAYDILFYLIPDYNWVANELRLFIELSLEKENTPALQSRGIKILKKIDRLK